MSPTPPRPGVGWTGGQFSLLRAIYGLALATRFPLDPLGGLAIAVAAGFAAGFHDRWLAPALFALAVASADVDGFWLAPLVFHVFLPARPYGSWDARGRPDPGGGWRFPVPLHHAIWGALAVAPLFLAGPWAWSAAGLAAIGLIPALRPGAWVALVGLQIAAIVATGSPVGGPGLALWLAFAADPGWIPPWRPGTTERVLYDGDCGLCHRLVRLILAEDVRGDAFRFAPLADGEDADSVVVVTEDGDRLERAAAAIHTLRRLGGGWRILGAALRLVPRPLADLGYDGVAALRSRLFPRPAGACPVVTPELRARFDEPGSGPEIR